MYTDVALVCSAVLGIAMLAVIVAQIIRQPREFGPLIRAAIGIFAAGFAEFFGMNSHWVGGTSRIPWSLQVYLWPLAGFGWAALLVSAIQTRPRDASRTSIGRATLFAAAAIAFLLSIPGLLVVYAAVRQGAMHGDNAALSCGMLIGVVLAGIPAIVGFAFWKLAVRRSDR